MFVEKLSEEFLDFLHRAYFTLAIAAIRYSQQLSWLLIISYQGAPWGSTNQAQCRADDGCGYVSYTNKREKVPKLIVLTVFQAINSSTILRVVQISNAVRCSLG